MKQFMEWDENKALYDDSKDSDTVKDPLEGEYEQ